MKKFILPLILTLFLSFTMAGYCNWYLPTGNYDPDNVWVDEMQIYDDNDATAGSNIIGVAKTWGGFIELSYYNELSCEKIKFLAYYKGSTGIEQIDIDLYYNGQWNDLHEGAFDDQVWTEIDVTPSQCLYSARVRFYAKKADTAYLYGFEFENVDYSEDLCTAGTATADSEHGAGYEASEAFDNLYAGNDDYWQTANEAMPDWLKYDFGEGNTETIAQYKLVGVDFATRVYDIEDWTFQGSNNDADWDVLDTQIGETFTQNAWNTYQFANVVAYRYYMIHITANQGGNVYGLVQEMEMMEILEEEVEVNVIFFGTNF